MLDVWSCGCASGEEPYTVAILWRERVRPRWPRPGLRLLATDVDPHLLHRLGRGIYPEGSVRELPADLAEAALEPERDGVRVADPYRRPILPALHDVRTGSPGGPFDLILCRNLAFTHFDEEGQRAALEDLVGALRSGGGLVLGRREEPPGGAPGLEPWIPEASVCRRPDRS